MSTLITTIIIGISLSMDAFSLSLVYGTLNFSKKRMLLLSLIVGLYHFFMPLFGAFFGNLITKYLVIDLDFVVFLIFLVIGIEMIISSIKENKDVSYIGILGFFMFGFSVSIDSFTTGIGLNAINNNYLEVSIIFAIISTMFTYLGLKLGKFLSDKAGKRSTIIGGFILILLAIYYLVK